MREENRYFHNSNLESPFALELVGISYCDGNYNIRREDKNLYVLEYIIKGTGEIIHNGKKFTACAGDVYLIHKNSTHQYYSSADDPWEKIFINMHGELIDALVKAYSLQDKVVISGVDAYDLFKEAYSIAFSDKPIEDIKKEIAIVVHKILQRVYETVKEESIHSDEAVMLKEFLDRSIYKRVTVEDISSSIFRSKDYTIKLFKKEFGTTPYNYLLDKKMEAARYLLVNSKTTIKEIAYSIGFEDQHYFSNVFKKKYLMSPKQYRNHEKIL